MLIYKLQFQSAKLSKKKYYITRDNKFYYFKAYNLKSKKRKLEKKEFGIVLRFE